MTDLPKQTSETINEEFVKKYASKRGVYRNYAATCKSLLQQLLDQRGIRVHSVECREKDPDGLREKLNRSGKEYQELEEVTDLAGIRIITHLADEVNTIASVIEEEFDVVPEHSVDKSQLLDPDRFGYLSLHYVCKMPDRRVTLPEYAPFKGLACEIQVRSILQHAWAEIEHDLGYKSAEAIPRPLRRRFSRLAALLETADDEFMRIRDDLSTYESEVRRDIREGPGSTVLLDKVSLVTFILESELVHRMDKEIAGIVHGRLRDPDLDALETAIKALAILGIKTIDDLERALADREELVVRYCQAQFGDHRHQFMPHGAAVTQLWRVMLGEKFSWRVIVDVFDRVELYDANLRHERAKHLVGVVASLKSQLQRNR